MGMYCASLGNKTKQNKKPAKEPASQVSHVIPSCMKLMGSAS